MAEEASTWTPIDLTDVTSGTFQALAPSVMRRTDDVALLYRGMVHACVGESESGKSILFHAETAKALMQGFRVLFIDFESDRITVVNRLMQLGATPKQIVKNLHYINPDTNPLHMDTEDNDAWLKLLSRTYYLVVIDGVTEAFSVFGVGTNDNDDVTRWGRAVPRRIAKETGAAVVVIDHVGKDREARGRFAIGAQSKMSYLTGASYSVEILEPLGVGMIGKLSIRIGKDRPGQVRPKSGPWRKGDRTQPTAVAVIDSTEPGRIYYSLEPFDTGSAVPSSDELTWHIVNFLNGEEELTADERGRKHPSQNAIVDAVRQVNPAWTVEAVKKALEECHKNHLISITKPEKRGQPAVFKVLPSGSTLVDPELSTIIDVDFTGIEDRPRRRTNV